MLTTRTLAALVLIAALASATNSAQAGYPTKFNGNHNFQGQFHQNFNHNFNNFHNFNTFRNFNGNHAFHGQTFHRPFVVTKPVFVPVFVPVKHHHW
jgi:hypothetical protein